MFLDTLICLLFWLHAALLFSEKRHRNTNVSYYYYYCNQGSYLTVLRAPSGSMALTEPTATPTAASSFASTR